jgi:hypothetical protein
MGVSYVETGDCVSPLREWQIENHTFCWQLINFCWPYLAAKVPSRCKLNPPVTNSWCISERMSQLWHIIIIYYNMHECQGCIFHEPSHWYCWSIYYYNNLSMAFLIIIKVISTWLWTNKNTFIKCPYILKIEIASSPISARSVLQECQYPLCSLY